MVVLAIRCTTATYLKLVELPLNGYVANYTSKTRSWGFTNCLPKMASEDVFEIKDYVAATEWERFIKHFEEFLYDLEPLKRHSLPTVMDGKFLHSDFYEKTSEIAFCDVNIVIIYTRLKESLIKTVNGRCCVGEDIDSDEPSIHEVMRDIASENNEFLYSNHCLSRWYGLKEFIIIHPADDTGVLNCRHRIVQSSAAIALVNTDCDIPVFVQLKEKERRLYSGVCVIPGAIINFEMVHLKDIHPQYMRLNGLYSIFKEKMCCDYISLPPVSVSVRLSYIFHWRNCIWPLKSYVGLCLSLREVCKCFNVIYLSIAHEKFRHWAKLSMFDFFFNRNQCLSLNVCKNAILNNFF